jgi:hypothetical protein
MYGVSLMTLAGCATMAWQHPYKNDNDYLQEKYTCINSSAKIFPPVFITEQVAPGYTTPVQTECKKSGNVKNELISSCTTSGGDYVPPVMSTYDGNENNRAKSFNACMESLGWVYKEVPKIK